jgi:hypothetical protein
MMFYRSFKLAITASALLVLSSLSFGIGAAPSALALAPGVRVGTLTAFSPGSQQKAATIQNNLDNAMAATSNNGPGAVSVALVRGQPVITYGGFYVCEVDKTAAVAAKTTPLILAHRWADGLKLALKTPDYANARANSLAGKTSGKVGTATTQAGSFSYYRHGRLIYVPKGMTLPIVLTNGFSSMNARPGDPIEGRIAEDISLGDTKIPAGSMVLGQITESRPGGRMAKAGLLGFKFNKIRTPDGTVTAIDGHILSGTTKYPELANGADMYKGETTSSRVKKIAIDTGIGAGVGALAGTAIGAIASHGYGTGRGAIAGVTTGAVLGAAGSLLLRKGADVNVNSGDVLKLQLDAPAQIVATE